MGAGGVRDDLLESGVPGFRSLKVPVFLVGLNGYCFRPEAFIVGAPGSRLVVFELI